MELLTYILSLVLVGLLTAIAYFLLTDGGRNILKKWLLQVEEKKRVRLKTEENKILRQRDQRRRNQVPFEEREDIEGIFRE